MRKNWFKEYIIRDLRKEKVKKSGLTSRKIFEAGDMNVKDGE